LANPGPAGALGVRGREVPPVVPNRAELSSAQVTWDRSTEPNRPSTTGLWRSHNPKVAGSNPAPATAEAPANAGASSFGTLANSSAGDPIEAHHVDHDHCNNARANLFPQCLARTTPRGAPTGRRSRAGWIHPLPRPGGRTHHLRDRAAGRAVGEWEGPAGRRVQRAAREDPASPGCFLQLGAEASRELLGDDCQCADR
jgi:hypothetical protein